MALIEIDGLPFLKMVDLSMANCLIIRWYIGISVDIHIYHVDITR